MFGILMCWRTLGLPHVKRSDPRRFWVNGMWMKCQQCHLFSVPCITAHRSALLELSSEASHSPWLLGPALAQNDNVKIDKNWLQLTTRCAWTCQEPSIQFVHLHASAYTVILWRSRTWHSGTSYFQSVSCLTCCEREEVRLSTWLRCKEPNPNHEFQPTQLSKEAFYPSHGSWVWSTLRKGSAWILWAQAGWRWSDDVNTKVKSTTFKFRKIGSIYLD